LRTENLKLQKIDGLGQARPDVATASWSAALLATLETGLLAIKMRHGRTGWTGFLKTENLKTIESETSK
jgi:hypothetical protein